MSDVAEGDVPYRGKFCECGLTVPERARTWNECPWCGRKWPGALMQREPHDGGPEIFARPDFFDPALANHDTYDAAYRIAAEAIEKVRAANCDSREEQISLDRDHVLVRGAFNWIARELEASAAYVADPGARQKVLNGVDFIRNIVRKSEGDMGSLCERVRVEGYEAALPEHWRESRVVVVRPRDDLTR